MRLIHSTLLPWCLLLLACQPAPSSQAAALGDYATLEQLAQAFREVSRHLLIGRANHILVSANILGDWMPRTGRFWKTLH